MANKMTLRDYFGELRTLAETNGRNDLVTFIDGRIEQLDKKNKSASGDRKPTATQVANEGIKAEIVNALVYATEDKAGMTVGEMIKSIPACEGLSSSKVTALVTQLVKAEKIVRKEIKGRAYFSKA